jgi:hypothetical protein
MSFIWTIVWLIAGTPGLHEWNGWIISLLVCAGLDIAGGGSRT